MENKHVLQYRCKCPECQGTGLYVGWAEHDGAGVVCHKCKGHGFVDVRIEYEDFEQKVLRQDIKRVYRTNPGIVLGEKEGVCTLEDFGGIPYEEWIAGKGFIPGTEDRQHTCPAGFYQSADAKLKPNWEKCDAVLGYTFSSCRHFPNKDQCWREWDEEFGGKCQEDVPDGA